MKSALEYLAVAISSLVFLMAFVLVTLLNPFVGIPFGIFLVVCVTFAIRHRSKHRHLPFSSPGFLAAFGLALGIVIPALQDLDIVGVCAAVSMLVLSFLILLVTARVTAAF